MNRLKIQPYLKHIKKNLKNNKVPIPMANKKIYKKNQNRFQTSQKLAQTSSKKHLKTEAEIKKFFNCDKKKNNY